MPRSDGKHIIEVVVEISGGCLRGIYVKGDKYRQIMGPDLIDWDIAEDQDDFVYSQSRLIAEEVKGPDWRFIPR